ncbi:MAG: GerA spore germination protein [Firmicutes bacterium]|nr:GerA spore germination protein [Bacillota bacterium]
MITNNVITNGYYFLKKLLLYQPPSDPPPFVLEETPDNKPSKSDQVTGELENSFQNLETFLRYANRVIAFLTKANMSLSQGQYSDKTKNLKIEYQALEKQQSELEPILLAYQSGQGVTGERSLSTSLEENRQIIETLYHLPLNKDIVFREIDIASDPLVKTMAVFIDGMVDTKIQNYAIFQPLMLLGSDQRRLYDGDLVDNIIRKYLPTNQVQRVVNFAKLQEGINNGDTALIFDGVAEAILVNTKGWEHRSIEKPSTEPTVRGSQSGFTENLRTNTTLIRTIMRNSDLVTELFKVGRRSQTTVAMLYMKSVANPKLVAEIKRRIQGVCTDDLESSGTLIQFIEDHPLLPFPQSLSTERPDRVGPHLSEGRVALIVDGNPYIHILPVSFFTFFHASEDFSLPLPIANFQRILRFFGALIATVLPALYIAISYFHVEALPTQLLLTIAGSREDIPFPAWFEVLIMEISFELIREAGVRVPGILGTTIGIVGAIILGQAAITAHIVSPAVVVVIAITGLASFTIPEYLMSSAIRVVRFLLLLFSIYMGLVGLATILLWLTVILCSMKSFGMPYMVPIAPRTIAGFDVIVRGPVYSQNQRPDALNTIDQKRQPQISRLWKKKQPAEKGDEE